MNLLIVGLGLIGGSLAKSLKKNSSHKIFGFDKDKSVLEKALEGSFIDGVLESLDDIDLIFICLKPEDIIKFIKSNKDKFKKGCIVCDVCGVKGNIVNAAESILYPDVNYVGLHPMAGKEVSGFENSSADLFRNASLIITVTEKAELSAVEIIEKLSVLMGFKRIVKTSLKEHDRIIAYTSQLAHIVSNAYIKSPTALKEDGFSAGSFLDLTRVAVLDEKLWAQLFILNRENLIPEIEILEDSIAQYKRALMNNDSVYLEKLLKDGKMKKLENLKQAGINKKE